METVDTIVIGAGIAGASVAWQLVQPGAAGQGASGTIEFRYAPAAMLRLLGRLDEPHRVA